MPAKLSPIEVSDDSAEAHTNDASSISQSPSPPSTGTTGTLDSSEVASLFSHQRLFNINRKSIFPRSEDGDDHNVNIIDDKNPSSSLVKPSTAGVAEAAADDATSPTTVSATTDDTLANREGHPSSMTSSFSSTSSSFSSVSSSAQGTKEDHKNKSRQQPLQNQVEEKPNRRVEYVQKAHMWKRYVRKRLARPQRPRRIFVSSAAAVAAAADSGSTINDERRNKTHTVKDDDTEKVDNNESSVVATRNIRGDQANINDKNSSNAGDNLVQQDALLQTGDKRDFSDPTIVTFADGTMDVSRNSGTIPSERSERMKRMLVDSDSSVLLQETNKTTALNTTNTVSVLLLEARSESDQKPANENNNDDHPKEVLKALPAGDVTNLTSSLESLEDSFTASTVEVSLLLDANITEEKNPQHSSLDPCHFQRKPTQADSSFILAQEATSTRPLTSSFCSITAATSEESDHGAISDGEVQQEEGHEVVIETYPTTSIIDEEPTRASDIMPNDVLQQQQEDQAKEYHNAFKGGKGEQDGDIDNQLRKQPASSSSSRQVKQRCSFSSLRLIDPSVKAQKQNMRQQKKTPAMLDRSFLSAARKSRQGESMKLLENNSSNATLVTVMTKSNEVKGQEQQMVHEETAMLLLDSNAEKEARSKIHYDSLQSLHAPDDSNSQVQDTGSEATARGKLITGVIGERGNLDDAQGRCLRRSNPHGQDQEDSGNNRSRREDFVNVPENTDADNAAPLLRQDQTNSGTDDFHGTLGTSTSNEEVSRKVEPERQRSSEHFVQNYNDTSVEVELSCHDAERREQTSTSSQVSQTKQHRSPHLPFVNPTIKAQKITVHQEEKTPSALDNLDHRFLYIARKSRQHGDSMSPGEKNNSTLTFGTEANGNNGPDQEQPKGHEEMDSFWLYSSAEEEDACSIASYKLLDSSTEGDDACSIASCKEYSPLDKHHLLLLDQDAGLEANDNEGTQNLSHHQDNGSKAAAEEMSTTVAIFDQQHLSVVMGQEDSSHARESSNSQCDTAVNVEQEAPLLQEPLNENKGSMASNKEGYSNATCQTSREYTAEDETSDEKVRGATSLDLTPNHHGQSKVRQEILLSSDQVKLIPDHDATLEHSNVTTRFPFENMELAKDNYKEPTWGQRRRKDEKERKQLVDLEAFCQGNETTIKQRINNNNDKYNKQEQEDLSWSAWWDKGLKDDAQWWSKHRPKTSVVLDDCKPKEVDGKNKRASFLDLVANHLQNEQELLKMLVSERDKQRDEQDRREHSGGDRTGIILPTTCSKDQHTMAYKDGHEKSLQWSQKEGPPSASADQDGKAATVNRSTAKEKPPPKTNELASKDPRVHSIHSMLTALTESDNLLLVEPFVDEYSFFEKYTRYVKASRRQRQHNSHLMALRPHNVLRSIEEEKMTRDGDNEEDAEKAEETSTNQREGATQLSYEGHDGLELDQPSTGGMQVSSDSPRQHVKDLQDAAAWCSLSQHISLGAPAVSNDMVERMDGFPRQDGLPNQNAMNDSCKRLETALHSLARTGSLKESSMEGPVERCSPLSGQSYDNDTTMNTSSDMSSESEYYSTGMSASMLSHEGLSIVPTTSMTSVDAANTSSQGEGLSADMIWNAVLDLSVESTESPSFLETDISQLDHGASQNVLVEFWEALVADSTESCGACIISKPQEP